MSCNQFLAPNGEPSLLYAQLEEKYGTGEAIRIWNWAKGEDFAEKDVNGDPLLSEVEQGMKGVPEVHYVPKIINALSSAEGLYKRFFKTNPEKFYQELIGKAGKQQVQWLRDYIERANPQSYQELITGIAIEMSYTVEINTAKDQRVLADMRFEGSLPNTEYYSSLTVPGGTNYTENEIATPAITPSIKGHAQFATDKGIGWFRSDNKEAFDLNIPYKQYTAGKLNEEAYTAKKLEYEQESVKTRRILELQSDLFQKGRDKADLVGRESYEVPIWGEDNTPDDSYTMPAIDATLTKENQFLQLLNKDNAWVTFFVKSIIQDSQKKGYEKVLFPKGDTAAKIEGHQTVEDFIQAKQSRLSLIEYDLAQEKITKSSQTFATTQIDPVDGEEYTEFRIMTTDSETGQTDYEVISEDLYNEIIKKDTDVYKQTLLIEKEQIKKEIEDAKSGKLKISAIANFYETTIYNVLKKQGFAPAVVTDEYGNEWYEVKLGPKLSIVSLSLNPGQDTISIQPDSFKYTSSKAFIDSLNKIYETAKQNPDQLYVLPFKAESLRLQDKNLSALELANILDKTNPPANVAFSPDIARMFQNIPRNFLSTQQTAPESLSISPAAIRKQMDTFFVRKRTPSKELREEWFEYEAQKDVLDVILYKFFEVFNNLSTNQDMQNEMKALNKTITEYSRDKILQDLDTVRQNWLAVSQVDTENETIQGRRLYAAMPAEMREKAPVMSIYFTDIINAFSGSENSFWAFALKRMEALGIKPKSTLFEDDDKIVTRTEEGDIEFNEGTGVRDYSDDAFQQDMKDTASARIKLFLAVTPQTTFRAEDKPKRLNLNIANQDTRERIKLGTKTDVILKQEYAGKNELIPVNELRRGELDPKSKSQRTISIGLTTEEGINEYRLIAQRRLTEAEITPEFVQKTETELGFTPQAGDIVASVQPYIPDTHTLQSELNSLQMGRLVDFELLFQDITGLLADKTPSWEVYKQVMQESGNANILRVLNRIEKAPEHIRKEFVSVFSSHYQRMSLVLLKRTKDGMIDTRIIDANRNSEIQTLIRFWQENQKDTELLKDTPEGKIVDPVVAEELYTELIDIYNTSVQPLKTGDELRRQYGSRWKEFHTEDITRHADQTRELAARRKNLFNRVLELNGITLSTEALNDLETNVESWGKASGIYSIYAGFTADKKEPIGLIDRLVWSLYASEAEEDQDRHYKVNNPLYTENKVTNMLARIQLKYTPQIYSQTARSSEGKTIYNFGLNTALSHAVRMLKEDAGYRVQFLDAHFAKHSWLLKRLEDNAAVRSLFQMSYLDGLKNEYGSRDGVTRPGMSDREQWLTILGLFINKGNKRMHMVSLTHSDKTRTPLFNNIPRITNTIRQGAVENDGRGGVLMGSRQATTLIFNHVFRAEYARATNAGGEQIAGYEKGKKYFYMLPKMNYTEMQKLLKVGKISSEEFDLIWNENKELQPESGRQWEQAVKRVIELQLNDMIEDTISSLENSGLFEELVPGTNAYYMKLMTQAGYRFMGLRDDRTEIYEDPSGVEVSAAEYKELQKILLATDYTVNSFVFNTSLAQLFYGDPALTFKGTVAKTIVEYGKRLAKDVAPGRDGDFEHSPAYRAITVKDWEPLAKELASIPAYGSSTVNATDAQELTTVREHLDVLWAYGKISKNVYQRAIQIINDADGGFYTFKDIPELETLIMQPMKPVYAKLDRPVDGVMSYDYIKSSSFPLYPPAIAGMELDKLRKQMEKPVDGSSPIARLNFISAKKVGAPAEIPALFRHNGTIEPEVFESELWKNAQQSLTRDGFRIQQEVPYDEDKDSILTVSQMNKLIVELITNMEGTFNYRGQELTGTEIRALKEDLRKQLITNQHQKLIKNIGATYDPELGYIFEDKKRFYSMLSDEALNREGYTVNDIMALTTTTDDGKLLVPLLFSPSAAKFESLAMSMVKKAVEIKMPGRSFVQGAPAGFQFWEDSNINQSEVVWTKDFKGPLQTAHMGYDSDVVYQGYNNADEREVNYFTTSEKEAKDYGSNVRAVKVDRTGFLHRRNDQEKYFELYDEFKAQTATTFDILDNTPEGLRIQQEFFTFLSAKGYKGMDYTGGDENSYVIAFNKSSISPAKQTVIPAQILVGFNYFKNNGERVNIQDYIIEQDGRKMLNTEKLPPELFQLIGARIPNQKFNSMLPIEIVGFLPEEMGDIVIVPAAITKQMGADFDVDKLYTYHRAYKESKGVFSVVTDNYKERLGANQEEYEELERATVELLQRENVRPDKQGRYAEFKEYLGRIVDQKYPDGNVPKHSVLTNESDNDNLKNQYFDIHWSVLTDPKVFPLMMAPLDKKDLSDEAQEVGQTLGSEYYFSPSYQLSDFQSMKGAKLLVALTSLALTNNAVVEDKNIRLASYNEDGELENTSIDVYIDGKLKSLTHVSGYGVSYYNGEKRNKSDNIQIQQSESVDHAKNRVIDKINLNPYTAAASLAMSRLQTADTEEPGEALALDYNARMLTQPIIRQFADKMSRGNDSLSSMFNTNLADSVYEELIKEYEQENLPTESFVMDAQGLQETLGMKPSSKEFLSRQVQILNKFMEFYKVGQQLSTLQQVTSQDTNGAGKDVLHAIELNDKKQKLVAVAVQGDKLLSGLESVHGTAERTEAGVAYDVTVGTVTSLYLEDFPYDMMQNFFTSVKEESGKTDELSVYYKQRLARALKSYVFSKPDLGLFQDAYTERQRLMFGPDSLAQRIKAAKTTWGKYNYFLQRLNVEIDPDGLYPDTVTYHAAKATREDDFENSRAWLDLFNSAEENEKKIAEDLLRYSMATGGIQHATNFVKYIPWSVIEGTAMGQALHTVLENDGLAHIANSPELLRQLYQHHPEMARQLSATMEETGKSYESTPDSFTLPPLGDESPASKLIQQYTAEDGTKVARYPRFLSQRSKRTNTWVLFENTGYDEKEGEYVYKPIDLLGDTGFNEYTHEMPARSVVADNRAFVPPTLNIISQNLMVAGASPQALNSAGQIGITKVNGTAADITKSLQVIALDKQQPSHLRVVSATLSEMGDNPVEAWSREKLGVTTPLTLELINAPGAQYRAQYAAGANILTLNLGASVSKVAMAEDLIHEMLHRQTVMTLTFIQPESHWKKFLGAPNESTLQYVRNFAAALKSDEELMKKVNALEELRKELYFRLESRLNADYGIAYTNAAKDRTGGSDEHKVLFYALSSIEEFVSHSLSSPTLMAWMNQQKWNEKKTIVDHLKELFSQFWGALTRFMNINPGTALEEAVKRTLDLLMYKQEYKGQYARMNLENFALNLANINPQSSSAIDSVSKLIGKLEEEKWMLISSQPSLKTPISKAKRRREIESLKEEIQNLKEDRDIMRIPKIATAQLNWVEQILRDPNPTPTDLNTAQKIADMWQGASQILFGDATLNMDNEIGEISKHATKLLAAIVKKSKEVLSQKLEISENDLRDGNIKDVHAGEVYSRSLLAAATTKVTAKIAGFATDMARQEDEQVYRELEELKVMQQKLDTAAKERGMALTDIYTLFTDVTKDNWGRTMQYSSKWFQTRADLIRHRNGAIKGIDNTEELSDDQKRAKKAAIWKKFNEAMDKIAIGVDTNKFFVAETGEFKPDITEAKKQLAEVVGEDHVDTVLERAQRRYLLYLEHRQDMMTLIDSELQEALTQTTSAEERAKLLQKADEQKADFQNRHSPNVFFSDSNAKSLAGASEKYTTFAPKADNKDMWSDKFKQLTKDHSIILSKRSKGENPGPSLLELYEDYYAKIDQFVGYLPATEQSMASRNFLPSVPRTALNQETFNFKTWISGMQERFVRSVGANSYEEYLNQRLYSKIPVEYVEPYGEIADRSQDLIGIAKLFAMMATHYRYASASKDVVDLGETILKEVHRARLEGNSQMIAPDGTVVTVKEGLNNTLKGIEYLKDYLIYRQPRKLEANLGGKLYVQQTSAGKVFTINPLKQKKISDRITELILQKQKLEDQYNNEEITENQYLADLEKIDAELRKYEGFSLYGSKIGDKLIGINQLKQLSYNPFTAAANLSFGMISGFIHGSGKADYTTAQFMAAVKMMIKARTDKKLAMKLHNLMDRLGVVGDYVDSRYGKKLELREDKSKLKKALDPFAMMRSTDFMMKGATTLAILMNRKVEVSGEQLSILETHNDKGYWDVEKFGDRPEWYNEDTAEQTEWNKLKNKIIRVNTIIHGNTDKNSPKLLNKFIIGRLLGQFRLSWLPEGWFNRFGSERYDEELQRAIKGRYKTMGSLGIGGSLLVLGRQMLNAIPGVQVNAFEGRILKSGDKRILLTDSELDMENMRRNFSEISFYLLLFSAIAMLKYLADDDDENKVRKASLQVLINMLIRSKQDIDLYASPGVFNAVMKNPIPAADVIIDYVKLMSATKKFVLNDDYEFRQWLMKFTKAGLPIPQATQVNKWDYMISRNLDEFE